MWTTTELLFQFHLYALEMRLGTPITLESATIVIS